MQKVPAAVEISENDVRFVVAGDRYGFESLCGVSLVVCSHMWLRKSVCRHCAAFEMFAQGSSSTTMNTTTMKYRTCVVTAGAGRLWAAFGRPCCVGRHRSDGLGEEGAQHSDRGLPD